MVRVASSDLPSTVAISRPVNPCAAMEECARIGWERREALEHRGVLLVVE